MPLSVPDLTRANLLDSPSSCLDTGAVYWLVYATDNPVMDLGAVYDAVNAQQPALLALGGATSTSAGVAVPVKLLASAPTCVVDSVVDPIRELDLGTDLTLFGLGIGPRIGAGAVLRLTFVVPGNLGGMSAGGAAAATAKAGSEVLATANASGQLAANSSRAANIIAKTKQAAGGAASSVFGDLKFILIAALVVILLYFFVQLRKA